MATTRGLTLATTVRVIDWVHCNTAGLGANALPAVTTGFTDLDELVLGVTNNTNGCTAIDWNTAHFGAWKTKDGVWAVLSYQLHAGSSGTAQLAAAAWLEFDVVDRGTDRNVAKRQAVAWLDLGALTVLQDLTNTDVLWSENIGLVAIEVVQEQDATAAVRVVFDRCDLGWNPVLVPTEVDQAVLLLVATAAVTAGLAAVAVTATGAGLALEQRLFWRRLGDLGEV